MARPLARLFSVTVIPPDRFDETSLKGEPDLVLVNSTQSIDETLAIVSSLRSQFHSTPLLLCIAPDLRDDVGKLLDKGVSEVVILPEGEREIIAHINHLLAISQPVEESIRGLKERIGLRQIVGESAEFIAELMKLPVVSASDVNVLITGETGTGKELFARAIHYLSPRSDKPFIPVNCSAIPVDLFENEFFGHEEGAYTGAGQARPGLVQEAEGGTLFLDEVDCLPPLAQVKILRLIQEREWRSLGSTKVKPCNMRVVAATNTDIETVVQQGSFRRDLYYRLNVVPIVIPPLRNRRSDIVPLAMYFLKKYCAAFKKNISGISPSALLLLQHHSWPGNVRELEHIVERAVVLTSHDILEDSDIGLPISLQNCPPAQSFRALKANVVAQFEKSYLEDLLRVHNGNISQAARAANKNRRAFWELLRKHRINSSRTDLPG